MNSQADLTTWWDLHLRRARGEILSESEQAFYDAETNRQDQEAPRLGNLEALKTLLATVAAMAQESSELRERLLRLEAQVRTVEQALVDIVSRRRFLG
jgi:hypothetical protein